MIWTEKYRPKTFDEIYGQKHVVGRIQAFVRKKNMPHLLFSGPAGIGKTTLSLIIAKQLFGASWKENFLELNASDDRGIDVVRNTIKDFSRTKSLGNVPFKIIYLDECDSLTKDAQQALRRTMETYVKSTRFILSCNYSSKIIDPIQSRCSIFRFRPLLENELCEVIEKIAEHENLKIEKETIKSLYDVTRGDVRKTINLLQSCSALSDVINNEVLSSIVSLTEPDEIKNIISVALKGDFKGARDGLLNYMLNHGLSGIDIIKQIQINVWELEIDDNKKMELIEKCGEYEFRLVEGSDEYVQLEALLASIAKC